MCYNTHFAVVFVDTVSGLWSGISLEFEFVVCVQLHSLIQAALFIGVTDRVEAMVGDLLSGEVAENLQEVDLDLVGLVVELD